MVSLQFSRLRWSLKIFGIKVFRRFYPSVLVWYGCVLLGALLCLTKWSGAKTSVPLSFTVGVVWTIRRSCIPEVSRRCLQDQSGGGLKHRKKEPNVVIQYANTDDPRKCIVRLSVQKRSNLRKLPTPIWTNVSPNAAVWVKTSFRSVNHNAAVVGTNFPLSICLVPPTSQSISTSVRMNLFSYFGIVITVLNWCIAVCTGFLKWNQWLNQMFLHDFRYLIIYKRSKHTMHTIV